MRDPANMQRIMNGDLSVILNNPMLMSDSSFQRLMSSMSNGIMPNMQPNFTNRGGQKPISEMTDEELLEEALRQSKEEDGKK